VTVVSPASLTTAIPAVERLYATVAARLLGQGVLGKPERLKSLLIAYPRPGDLLMVTGIVLTTRNVAAMNVFTARQEMAITLASLIPGAVLFLTALVRAIVNHDPVGGLLGALGADRTNELSLIGGKPLAPPPISTFLPLSGVEVLNVASNNWTPDLVAFGLLLDRGMRPILFSRLFRLAIMYFAFHGPVHREIQPPAQGCQNFFAASWTPGKRLT